MTRDPQGGLLAARSPTRSESHTTDDPSLGRRLRQVTYMPLVSSFARPILHSGSAAVALRRPRCAAPWRTRLPQPFVEKAVGIGLALRPS
jgi:hypothetical protein